MGKFRAHVSVVKGQQQSLQRQPLTADIYNSGCRKQQSGLLHAGQILTFCQRKKDWTSAPVCSGPVGLLGMALLCWQPWCSWQEACLLDSQGRQSCTKWCASCCCLCWCTAGCCVSTSCNCSSGMLWQVRMSAHCRKDHNVSGSDTLQILLQSMCCAVLCVVLTVLCCAVHCTALMDVLLQPKHICSVMACERDIFQGSRA